ncbi:MAG: hypothetical protein ACKV0T_10355 [Planctomycetales bacterium]
MTRTRMAAWTLLLTIAVSALALVPDTVRGCPFCSAPSLTLSEQFSKADAAVLVKWVGGEMPKAEQPGSTTYEIVEAPRTPFKSVAKGKKITLERYRAGKKGSLALLFGSRTKGEVIEWGGPLEVTETSYKYIAEAPAADAPPEKRLGYYLKFLEFSEDTVSNDAYAEFANAPYKDIVPLADEMPREKLREWIMNPKTPASRIGLYGLMLGLCGTADDVALMEKKIVEQTEDFRLGIDGVIGGYLLLTGEDGLKVIEDSKLLNKKAPFAETYAAMQALRFMWSFGNGRIAPDRLKSSMRLLIDRPELVDLVIADLARWKDWSLQERLMNLYGVEEYNVPSIKRAIIRYMIASTKDVPASPETAQAGSAGATDGSSEKKLPVHAVAGAKYLEKLREKDPKNVSEAERFFF